MRNLHKSVFGLITEKRDKVILCGVFGFVFMLVFMILGGKAQADLQPIKTIELTSQNTSYANNQPGAWKIDKSAEWIGEGKARITFEVNSVAKTTGKPRDVIFVLDNSGSMAGDKLDRVKSDAIELATSLLSVNSNTAALINFNTTASVYSSFTNNLNTIRGGIENLGVGGATNYYDALKKVEDVLSNYTYSQNRELIVLFLSDGYPCEQTPEEVAEFKYLKDTYPYSYVAGVQYEMGEDILEPIKTVSDVQYIADMETLNNVLFEAALAASLYDDFVLTDYIDDTYFDEVLATKASIGSATVAMEGTTPKVTWNISGIYRSGTRARLTIDIKLKGSGSSYADDTLLPTNKRETVKSNIISTPNENITSTLTPKLALKYSVSYDANAPHGCTVSGTLPSTAKYTVYSTVEKSSNKLSCEGYSFKGWVIDNDSATAVNDDYFVMPEENVVIKALWSTVDIEKSMDGNVLSRTSAVFETGGNVNTKLKIMAGAASNIGYLYDDYNIRAIKMADSLPQGFVPTSDNTLSTSQLPIYGWFDNGTIYLYTDADSIRTASWSYHMFDYMKSLTDISGLKDLTFPSGANIHHMFFADSSLTDLSPIADWDVSQVKDISSMFGQTSITDVDALSNWNVSSVTDISGMFYEARDLSDLSGLANWDVSNVEDMQQLFRGAASITNVDALSNWHTPSLEDMSSMFTGAINLANVNGLSNWDTSNVIYMRNLFDMSGYPQNILSDISGLSKWNLSSVTTMKRMFYGLGQLTNLDALSRTQRNGYISWDTSNVQDMSEMFNGDSALMSINGISNWDVSGVTDMTDMFYAAFYYPDKVTNLNALSRTQRSGYVSWDTSNVVKMTRMFGNCDGLTNIDGIGNWNVSSVEDMDSMFVGFTEGRIASIDSLATTQRNGYKSWDVSNVKTMHQMFMEQEHLTDIDGVSNWDTSSVENMVAMFSRDSMLSDIDGVSNWNTSSVTDMSYMFRQSTQITSVSALSGWNVSSVENMSWMFGADAQITDLQSLNGWTVPSDANMYAMFNGIPSSVARPTWATSDAD